MDVYNDFSSTSAFLTLTVLFLMLIWHFTKPSQDGNLPPGPKGLPIVGVLPFLDKNLYKSFAQWGEKYGSIISVPILGQRFIVLNEIDVVREVFSQELFSGRPKTYRSTTIAKNRGLLQIDGSKWRQQRRFALSTLRDFGMGKGVIESKIQEELTEMVRVIRLKNGEPFDIRQILVTSVCNIIVSVLFGKRFDHADHRLQTYMRCLDTIGANLQTLNKIVGHLPFLRFLPGDIFNYWKTIEAYETIEGDIQSEIDYHKESYHPELTRDYIDAYLNKMADPEQNQTFTDLQLLKSATDMFLAGMETTSSTLRWGVLYMILHADVQERVHSDIYDMIGDSQPEMCHRTKLPYVEATTNEILRCSSLTPGALPHSNHEECFLRGYRIPKNSNIIANLWNINHDPNHLTKPDSFDPDRFLNGGKITKPSYFVPFSVGKRSCLGESLAKMELFIFFAGLMQHFRFYPEDMKHLPTDEPRFGSINSPKPFKVRAIARF